MTREIFHITTDQIDQPIRECAGKAIRDFLRVPGKWPAPDDYIGWTELKSLKSGYDEGYRQAIGDAQMECEAVCLDCMNAKTGTPDSAAGVARMCTVRVGRLLKDKE